VSVEKRKIEVDALPANYLVAGKGPPLLLLHAVEESAFDWRWVLCLSSLATIGSTRPTCQASAIAASREPLITPPPSSSAS
jgi:hypothetical protein